MDNSPSSLCEAVTRGEVRALARVLSFIEEHDRRAATCLDLLFPYTGRAFVLGVTGAPGAGKSTLVDRLSTVFVRSGKRVGVIAIDPSSPFSGGALLGDRIRMVHAGMSSEVFIRSMATRGALGGVAPHVGEAALAFDAAGFDYVIIETVGVGQSEVEIARTADCVCLVLVPGMGDTVQALKAGVLEIADLFVINKADAPGVQQLEKELAALVALAPKQSRKPQIVKTVATVGHGAEEVVAAVETFLESAALTGEGVRRKGEFLNALLVRLILHELEGEVAAFLAENPRYAKAREELLERRASPGILAEELVKEYRRMKTSTTARRPKRSR